jgi:hypothetical protein
MTLKPDDGLAQVPIPSHEEEGGDGGQPDRLGSGPGLRIVEGRKGDAQILVKTPCRRRIVLGNGQEAWWSPPSPVFRCARDRPSEPACGQVVLKNA